MSEAVHVFLATALLLPTFLQQAQCLEYLAAVVETASIRNGDLKLAEAYERQRQKAGAAGILHCLFYLGSSSIELFYVETSFMQTCSPNMILLIQQHACVNAFFVHAQFLHSALSNL